MSTIVVHEVEAEVVHKPKEKIKIIWNYNCGDGQKNKVYHQAAFRHIKKFTCCEECSTFLK